MKPSDNKLWHF